EGACQPLVAHMLIRARRYDVARASLNLLAAPFACEDPEVDLRASHVARGDADACFEHLLRGVEPAEVGEVLANTGHRRAVARVERDGALERTNRLLGLLAVRFGPAELVPELGVAREPFNHGPEPLRGLRPIRRLA